MKSRIKLISVYILQIVMRILRFIPMASNQIVFCSYTGLQYSCNPRYISEYLIQNHPGKFEIIWLLEQPNNYKFLQNERVKVAHYTPLNKLWYALRAKITVINAGSLYSWAPLRKGQVHINTWHGGGYYKRVGINEERKDKYERDRVRLASKNTSYFLSTNKCFTDNEIRHDFEYQGAVLNIGYPRNDIFFRGNRKEIRDRVCTYFGIDESCKIIMYAPTFRYVSEQAYDFPNFDKVKTIASNRFGGEWVVLTRMHYYASDLSNDQNTYDASYRPDMPDMQELLMASDMLISDYSSCIWDFSFTERPCLLYTPDLDEYTENRGFGIDIYEWGFPVCKTEEELLDTIENFDLESFQKAMQKHHDDLGSFEDGHATEKVCKLIYDHGRVPKCGVRGSHQSRRIVLALTP